MTRRPKQLSLNVRCYTVHCDGLSFDVQAATTGGAKYQAFKLARTAELFSGAEMDFPAFLSRRPTAREISR